MRLSRRSAWSYKQLCNLRVPQKCPPFTLGYWPLVCFYKSCFGFGLSLEGVWNFWDISSDMRTIINRRVSVGLLIWWRNSGQGTKSQSIISGYKKISLSLVLYCFTSFLGQISFYLFCLENILFPEPEDSIMENWNFFFFFLVLSLLDDKI